MEGESEVGVVQKGGGFEEGREEVAGWGDSQSAHGIEGREGKVIEGVRGVAFDEGGPC